MRRVNVGIASPGDVTEERDGVLRVFSRWNNTNDDVTVNAVMWEYATVPALGAHPQEIINRSLITKSDILLAIFWSKLGTPTASASSGTVEEIREFVRTKGPGRAMVYFCTRDLPHDVDANELVRLREFKAELRTQGLYREYKSLAEFENELYRDLDVKVREFIEGKHPAPAQEVANDLASPLHKDQRLSQPIDFGATLKDISQGFTARMEGFARLDGAGPDKFFDLGAHVYNSVARCLDRFLTYSAVNVEQADRGVIRHISTKLKALASSSGEYLKKGFPLFWSNGEEIARELAAHVDYLNAICAMRTGRGSSEREIGS